MEQVILIRFSEIHLKGKNKGYFLKLLYTILYFMSIVFKYNL